MSDPSLFQWRHFQWRHFQADLIFCAVRWYLRYALGYRDVAEPLQERGVRVDRTTPRPTRPDPWNRRAPSGFAESIRLSEETADDICIGAWERDPPLADAFSSLIIEASHTSANRPRIIFIVGSSTFGGIEISYVGKGSCSGSH